MISPESLDPLQEQLQSESSRTRDGAAEQLSDVLEYGEMAPELRITVGNRLIDALWRETDETALEAILNALGRVNFRQPVPQVSWRRLAEFLPKLRTPLLGEYAISTLGECGDAEMIAYVEPYLRHPEVEVRQEAETAVATLARYKSGSI